MPFYSSSGSSYRPAKKCQMRHCDREVGFYESSNKNSFYCPRHSCHANYKCRTPSEDGERFCKTHAVCAHYGCGKRISEEDKSFRYSKGGKDSWLCSDHRCKADDCYKHRRDSNTKYCDDHAKENKCEVSDCSSDRSSKHYCEKHTCQHPDCTRKTLNSGRSKEKCRHHQPCASPGCTRHVDLDAYNIPKKFCAHHGQCRIHRCHGIVRTGSWYCAEHECYIVTCHRPKDLSNAPGTRFCHRRCTNSLLDSKGHHVQRCSQHTCERPGCCEKARTDGSKSPFCISHGCMNKHCRNPAKVKNGCCWEEACVRPECGMPKSAGCGNYCFNHRTTHNDSSTLTSSRSTTGRYSHGSIGNRPALVVPFDWAYLRSPTSGSREWRHAQMDRAYRGIYSRPRYY
ncbi:unnamed protein product [Fusarium graminearum]|uniref:Uncharacterized protein n=1 Tax=Gibberella zeae (strain ATCC MYA-4620 / CBS 123657 / FGSC 9075 / NRRL 31084 / PH-1) TaxID=229533 RepID=I1S7X0_GIBZE|nr:hypothetical protein FGSG_12945 [Fusarium graminearum PH-1]ESU12713.1 hypothetical protein FGSG_12945 [Fusarium graminearum PH-1]CZS72260.1 unnamed protein product [Fusarium graminearum]|eukprot:XP_011326220.1 hypothetical protein FGSG_12945 [Fusarium graminearum PH-1]